QQRGFVVINLIRHGEKPMTRRDEEFSPAAAGIPTDADEQTGAQPAFSQVFADPRVAAATLRTERFKAALLAAERRVNGDALADPEATDFLAERRHFPEQSMTGDDRQLEVRFRRGHRLSL